MNFAALVWSDILMDIACLLWGMDMLPQSQNRHLNRLVELVLSLSKDMTQARRGLFSRKTLLVSFARNLLASHPKRHICPSSFWYPNHRPGLPLPLVVR